MTCSICDHPGLTAPLLIFCCCLVILKLIVVVVVYKQDWDVAFRSLLGRYICTHTIVVLHDLYVLHRLAHDHFPFIPLLIFSFTFF